MTLSEAKAEAIKLGFEIVRMRGADEFAIAPISHPAMAYYTADIADAIESARVSAYWPCEGEPEPRRNGKAQMRAIRRAEHLAKRMRHAAGLDEFHTLAVSYARACKAAARC